MWTLPQPQPAGQESPLGHLSLAQLQRHENVPAELRIPAAVELFSRPSSSNL